MENDDYDFDGSITSSEPSILVYSGSDEFQPQDGYSSGKLWTLSTWSKPIPIYPTTLILHQLSCMRRKNNYK